MSAATEPIETPVKPIVEKKVFITSAEIEKHKSRDDLWMVVNGKVYDVTPFVDEHPGGEEVLVDCGGQDATTAFEVCICLIDGYVQG